jgi:hypothetical protein
MCASLKENTDEESHDLLANMANGIDEFDDDGEPDLGLALVGEEVEDIADMAGAGGFTLDSNSSATNQATQQQAHQSIKLASGLTLRNAGARTLAEVQLGRVLIPRDMRGSSVESKKKMIDRATVSLSHKLVLPDYSKLVLFMLICKLCWMSSSTGLSALILLMSSTCQRFRTMTSLMSEGSL